MTLTELRYIVAVARLHHFGRAAEACFVSQPTLSVAIRKLEEELNISLFERTPGDIRLTDIGKSIVKQAEKVLVEADKISTIAKENADPLSIQLRLGGIYTIGPYLFPYLITELHEIAPHMPLYLEENYTSVLTERLKQGDVDAILVALPYNEPNIQTIPLYEEAFVVAMPCNHPWAVLDAVPGDQLHNEKMFLLGAGHCLREQIFAAFPKLEQNVNSRIQKTLEGSSLETILQMVASGAGITILPSSASVNRDNKSICYRPFISPAPSRRVAIAWRKSFARPQALDALCQAIRACELDCLNMIPYHNAL